MPRKETRTDIAFRKLRKAEELAGEALDHLNGREVRAAHEETKIAKRAVQRAQAFVLRVGRSREEAPELIKAAGDTRWAGTLRSREAVR